MWLLPLTYPLRRTWVSCGICINATFQVTKTWLPQYSTTLSNWYVLLHHIKSVFHLLWSPCCSPRWFGYLYRPSLSKISSLGYVSNLSSSTISSLIASFCFIPVPDDFCYLSLLRCYSDLQPKLLKLFQGLGALDHTWA